MLLVLYGSMMQYYIIVNTTLRYLLTDWYKVPDRSGNVQTIFSSNSLMPDASPMPPPAPGPPGAHDILWAHITDRARPPSLLSHGLHRAASTDYFRSNFLMPSHHHRINRVSYLLYLHITIFVSTLSNTYNIIKSSNRAAKVLQIFATPRGFHAWCTDYSI